MRIYSVYDGCEDHAEYFTNKAKAIQAAQAAADASDTPIDVQQNHIPHPSLKLVLDILNQRGWAQNVSTVHTCQPRRQAPEDES